MSIYYKFVRMSKFFIDSLFSVIKKENSIKKWERKIKRINLENNDILSKLLHDDDVFVDVGANTGSVTEELLKRKKLSLCILFEPIPVYYNYCKEKFSKSDNVIVENYALTDKKGEFSIFMSEQNFGWNTMIGSRASHDMKELSINGISFDEYIEKIPLKKINLIKIDVEGAEYKVLNGMKKTIAKYKPIIFCEIGFGKSLHPNWNEEVEIFEWIFNNGYKRIDYNVEKTQDVILYPLAN